MLTSKSTAVYSLQQSCKERISLQTPQEEGQTQRCSSTWDSNFCPTQSGKTTLCWLRTMTSDLEVTTQ